MVELTANLYGHPEAFSGVDSEHRERRMVAYSVNKVNPYADWGAKEAYNYGIVPSFGPAVFVLLNFIER